MFRLRPRALLSMAGDIPDGHGSTSHSPNALHTKKPTPEGDEEGLPLRRPGPKKRRSPALHPIWEEADLGHIFENNRKWVGTRHSSHRQDTHKAQHMMNHMTSSG